MLLQQIHIVTSFASFVSFFNAQLALHKCSADHLFQKSENFSENMHVEALFGDVTALHASVLPEKEIYHTCFSQDIFEQLSCIT